MRVRNTIERIVNRILAVGRRASFPELALTYEEASARRSVRPGPIEELFFENKGRLAAKWTHYLPIYDRVFAPYRGQRVKMLEIGVSRGGSLELWRNYFGPEATIFGIDIEPACAERFDPPNQVRIGSQDDPAFLRSVVGEMGGLDIVLDDGSHIAPHQDASFRVLFPLLKAGGLYIIEDIHTSYWPSHDGGYRRRGTAVERVKTLIDDMHGWHHERRQVLAEREHIGSILVYDSMVVIEKVDRKRPGHFTTPDNAE